MKYSEYIQNGGIGIIKLLSDNDTLSYLGDDVTALDSAFLLENGNKKFTLSLENMLTSKNDLTPLANMMKVRFGKTWETEYNSIPKGSDPLVGEITTATGSINSDNTNTNQVAGYDSPNMVDDNANISKGSHTTNQKTTRTSYLDLTQLIGELQNNVFYGMLFNDIKNYLFLQMYGNERKM